MPSPVHYLIQQFGTGNGLVGLMNSAEFVLPLTDAGAGVVSTSLGRGVGPATFTRATVAWTKLSSGLWAQIASGSPRSCYLGMTTATGNYGGYLAEGAGIQLVTPTASIRDMTDASWVKVTMTTAKTATGIDGVANSASTLTAAGASSTILQTLVAAASSRTYSCWMKRRTGTGTILIMQGATTLDVTALINSSTYTLVQLNASVLNAAIGIQINTSTDAVDVDFNQFEASGFATTPMDSAGASRSSDVLTFPISGNMSVTAGTLYLECTCYQPTAVLTAQTRLISGSTGIPLFLQVGNGQLDIFDGANTNGLQAPTYPILAVIKTAAHWGGTTSNAFFSGTAGTAGTFDGDMSVTTNICIGARESDGLVNLYGTIKNVRIWQRQVPSAAVIAMTA